VPASQPTAFQIELLLPIETHDLAKGDHLTSAISPPILTDLTPAQTPESEMSRSGDRPVTCAFVLLAADGLAMVTATFLALRIGALLWPGFEALPALSNTPAQLYFAMPFAAIVLYLMAQGRYQEPMPFWTETRLVVYASFCVAGAEIAFGVLTNDISAASLPLVALLAFPVLATAANRLAKHAFSLAGICCFPVLVVSDGASAAEQALEADRSIGYRIVGRVDPDSMLASLNGSRLWSVLNRYGARRLLIVVEGDRQRRVVECALRERVPFTLATPPYAFPAFPCQPTSVFNHDSTLLSFQDNLSRPLARVAKTLIDVTAAVVLLVVTSPLFLVLAIASRLDGGPTFFAHRRVGAGGRPFYCLKFRTMMVDADRVLNETLARDPALAAEWAATRKLVDDPRVTRLGQFLRKTSLDELPQLINVLRLEMSLVGPRPIVESEVPFYGKDIALYYAIRPGLTGLWQVNGRSNISYARRVQLDVWYVNNWTIWHDIVVLLKTIPAVFSGRGAH
jgi:Undecaprenyl-phosphate galactose phosphotransferase WbaP